MKMKMKKYGKTSRILNSPPQNQVINKFSWKSERKKLNWFLTNCGNNEDEDEKFLEKERDF